MRVFSKSMGNRKNACGNHISEDGQDALGVHQEVLDGTSDFAQQMSIRQVAKQAFDRVC